MGKKTKKITKGDGSFSIGSPTWPGLGKLVEETGELTQVLGKLIGTAGDTKHWEGSDLKFRLLGEMGDVLAAIDFISEENLTEDDMLELEARRTQKLKTYRKWHANQDMR